MSLFLHETKSHELWVTTVPPHLSPSFGFLTRLPPLGNLPCQKICVTGKAPSDFYIKVADTYSIDPQYDWSEMPQSVLCTISKKSVE